MATDLAAINETVAEQNDLQLMDQVQVDPRAFALLYDRYINQVYGYCFQRLRQRETAEDATSMIFEKAFRNLDRFHGGSFRAWLFAIAHNTTIDISKGDRPMLDLDEVSAPVDHRPGPEETVIAREQSEQFRLVVESLTPEQRSAIELRLAGLSSTEICEVLGVTPGVLAARTYRAIGSMRQTIATLGQEIA